MISNTDDPVYSVPLYVQCFLCIIQCLWCLKYLCTFSAFSVSFIQCFQCLWAITELVIKRDEKLNYPLELGIFSDKLILDIY